MNLVGKIFTVLILVMSLVFMSFAVAVYATHKNWKEVVLNPEATHNKPKGLKYQLEDAQQENQQLRDLRDELDDKLAREKADKRQALAKLESENEELRRLRDQHVEELSKLRESQRESVAAMQATQETLAALRTEVDTLREKIRQAQADRDEHFKEVVQVTDELHQAVNELKRLKARQVTLAADLAKAKEVLRHFNLTVDTPIDDTPPDVEGVVLATPGSNLVEVSIGSDDGIREGHTLQVYRISGGVRTYLGRVTVVKTSPDKSVAKIDPNYRKGTIQKGDRVDSKLG